MGRALTFPDPWVDIRKSVHKGRPPFNEYDPVIIVNRSPARTSTMLVEALALLKVLLELVTMKPAARRGSVSVSSTSASPA